MAAFRRVWRGPRPLLTAVAMLMALAVVAAPTPVAAHSFLTVPLPISRLDGCRVGGVGGTTGNCPGPCPNSAFRSDTSSKNPAAVYRRGSTYEVRWTRNNHEGGIIRWAMVPVSEMWDMASHERNAFHWSCWNINRFSCNAMERHRDCYFDRDNLAFRDYLRIPDNLPDGDYVLGWTWYGGGEGPVGKQAMFGDYYDCSYVRVEGGNTLTEAHYPTFSGDSTGTCLSTVNRPGICKTEPCVPMPYVQRRVPVEFEGGRKPPPIYSTNFPNVATQYRYDYDYSVQTQSGFSEAAIKPAGSSVRVVNLRLVDIRTNKILWYTDLTKPIQLGYDAKLSILAEVTGPVAHVEWFINSRRTHIDSNSPFSIAGDFRGRFYELVHAKTNRRMFITARAVGRAGDEDYLSADLFFFKDGGVPSQYIGNSGRMVAASPRRADDVARAARLAAGKFVRGHPPATAEVTSAGRAAAATGETGKAGVTRPRPAMERAPVADATSATVVERNSVSPAHRTAVRQARRRSSPPAAE